MKRVNSISNFSRTSILDKFFPDFVYFCYLKNVTRRHCVFPGNVFNKNNTVNLGQKEDKKFLSFMLKDVLHSQPRLR